MEDYVLLLYIKTSELVFCNNIIILKWQNMSFGDETAGNGFPFHLSALQLQR
jgi:hypothetical protein